jgi:hypothetical protein
VQSPGVGTLQPGPLNSLLPVPAGGQQTGGQLHKNRACKETNHEKKHFFSFRLWICIWPTDYDRYLAWAIPASFDGGKIIILITKNNEYPFLYKLFCC